MQRPIRQKRTKFSLDRIFSNLLHEQFEIFFFEITAYRFEPASYLVLQLQPSIPPIHR